MLRTASFLFLPLSLFLLDAAHARLPAADGDRDGLDDGLEQRLLVKFAPAFFISRKECDGLPAEFAPGVREPRVVSRNGTVYGQVFARPSLPGDGVYIEIHYYHLWSRDCGRAGHLLDPEHVSGLLWAPAMSDNPEQWAAQLWYAGAHENTACDVSNGARARELEAEHRGPKVWVSRGKHASFLSPSACASGCGADTCDASTELRPRRLINLGERSALLNGALWVESGNWPLESKLMPDFDEWVISQLTQPKLAGVRILNRHLRTGQALLLAGDSTVDALDATARALTVSGAGTDRALQSTFEAVDGSLNRTAAAVATSGAKTGKALDVSAKGVGRSLRKTVHGVGRFLGAR